MFIRHTSVLLCALLGALALATASTTRGAVVLTAIPLDLVPGSLPLADPGINVLWDVNGDGTNDFNFTFRQPQNSGDVDWQANVFPINGAGIIATYNPTDDIYDATRLTLGTTIGSASSFTGAPVQGILGETYAGTPGGQFNATVGYLGFRFTVGTNNYYGWMNLSTARSSGIDFISAAYENTAGTAITAGAVPEPGTWTALVLGGFAGLLVLRRRVAA